MQPGMSKKQIRNIKEGYTLLGFWIGFILSTLIHYIMSVLGG